jgi:hypothetical protein
VHEILLNATQARGLGFCVSVAHAEYMARFFREHGLPAIALTAESDDQQRRSAQAQLRDRVVNFLFVVDLYNEGVDIPEVDTLLFLRPTESLTVFLQQFGRGLRLHPDKECLTILDFIGAHRREFRFAPRFRALSASPASRIDHEIEQGFPHLPSGCVVQLERVAQQRVLANVRESVRLLRPRMLADLRELGRYLEQPPTIAEALEYVDTSLDELLKRGLWSRMLHEAGLGPPPVAPDEDRLAKGIRRLGHLDDVAQIRAIYRYLDTGITTADPRILEMLHVALWGDQSLGWLLGEADARLRQNPAVVSDLQALLDYRRGHAPLTAAGGCPLMAGPLTVHAQYIRDEILVALGHWSLAKRPDQREGVLHLGSSKVDAFFVTLDKSEEDYSPTTMYEDYLISHDLFHWQSQSGTSPESPTGQRYIRHRAIGYTPLLFVRETKRLPSGLASPYTFLGPCDYVSHQGSRPISIVWKLKHPVPARLLRVMCRQQVG